MKNTTIILISIFLLSCKSKKEIIEIHTTDTIYKKEVIKIDKPQLNSILIENVCDSLGNLKIINYTSTSKNVKTTLKSDKNNIKLEVNIDSIISSEIEKYKSSIKTIKTDEISEVKNPLNLKLLIYSILTTIWIFRKPLLKLIKLL